MVSVERRFEILKEDADERGLDPKAWWLGHHRHQEALSALEGDARVTLEGGRMVAYDGLPVKVLAESPERFALWCKEGVLDL